jgi:hypothetical protein
MEIDFEHTIRIIMVARDELRWAIEFSTSIYLNVKGMERLPYDESNEENLEQETHMGYGVVHHYLLRLSLLWNDPKISA